MKFEDKVKGLREKKYKGKETKEFLADVSRMAQGEAYEYLLGEVDFCGAKIDLTYRPMIPRPETEFWVKQALDGGDIRDQISDGKVLDVFAGSGCIGFSILKNIQGGSVMFVDTMKDFDKQIEVTRNKNNIDGSRVLVSHSGVEYFVKNNTTKFDYIVAVPPYVPLSMKDEVMQELHNEHPDYFFDKDDGYYYHRLILSSVAQLLVLGGVLYMEFDVTQRSTIETMVKGFGFSEYTFLRDPYGHDYVLRVKNN